MTVGELLMQLGRLLAEERCTSDTKVAIEAIERGRTAVEEVDVKRYSDGHKVVVLS